MRMRYLLAAAGMLSVAGGCGVRRVANVGQLHQAVKDARPGEHIVLAAGTYRLRRTIRLRVPRVTLRGATGDRDDVVLLGGGMNVPARATSAISFEADDLTVRDLTCRDFYKYGLHIRAEMDVDRARIINVKTVNIGERHVKGSMGRGGHWADDVLIERLAMIQTEPRGVRPGHIVSPTDYIGGIDAMVCRNWVIRDLYARGIRGASGGGNAAIFLWNGVENVLIERCRIVDCCKGIALGNPSGPGRGKHHAVGGIIRNNTILRAGEWTVNNIGIELCNARDVKVYHNTIYSADAWYIRSVHILDDPGEGATSGVVLANNIIRGHLLDNTAEGRRRRRAGLAPLPEAKRGWGMVSNLHGWKDTADGPWRGTPVPAEWFRDPAAGDLHLTAFATPAIDRAEPVAEVTDDVDGDKRPRGDAPDVGADER